MVKDNANISDIDKLQHLLTCLEGEVGKRVKTIQVTGPNFQVAWDILTRRYDDHRLRLSTHLKRLLNMHPVKQRSANELTRILDEVDEVLRALELLGRPVDQCDDWLVQLYDDLSKFIENRARSLDAAFNLHAAKQSQSKALSKSVIKVASHHGSTTQDSNETTATEAGRSCPLCSDTHYLGACEKFKACTTSKRFSTVQDAKVCRNCLRCGHFAISCPSSGRCRIPGCGEQHHTLLHKQASAASASRAPNTADQVSVNTTIPASTESKPTLLATAMVNLVSPSGSWLRVRALLDPALERSFITLVLNRITNNLSRAKAATGPWPHLQALQLADPTFNQPDRIDCLLGADVYPLVIRPGLKQQLNGSPVAQDTVFGWVLTRPVASAVDNREPRVDSFVTTTSINDLLQRFWEVEEVPDVAHVLPADDECEKQHYESTHQRDTSGRFVLRLPFSRNPVLGGSRAIATSRFLQLERSLQAKPDLSRSYSDFIHEFEALGHMELVPQDEVNQNEGYYMPHHAVMKQDRSGTLRVVFNASQVTRTGLSLNDCLHAGPKLQTDLSVILTRWRFHRFVFTTDIVKMFRQFSIHPDDANWLRILWRDSPSQELRTFRMRRVVYGTACAPYQAIRSLLQLAKDGEANWPVGARLLKESVYVDDVLTGADSIEETETARDELISLLQSAGMTLDKWASNEPVLLSTETSSSDKPRSFSENDMVTTLGLLWCPAADQFQVRVSPVEQTDSTTKRLLLSYATRQFDPLGWFAPVVISVKLMIQQLWNKDKDWDQPVDEDILGEWRTLQMQLPKLALLRIPRWLGTDARTKWTLHGFADASQRAYAACMYVVTDAPEPRISLLIAKSKVAPIKPISIPRLELCAAVLLAKLVSSTISLLSLKPETITCYSDSQVELAWLAAHPSKWQTYVANRVGHILTTLPTATWQNVRSQDNPADLASRGLLPEDLLKQDLWLNGPSWLAAVCPNEEPRCLNVVTVADEPKRPVEDSIARFSSLRRLLHTYALIMNWRSKLTKPEAIKRARQVLIRSIQREFFEAECRILAKGGSLPTRSKLRAFLPFLDEQGVLRVGGRLQNASISFEERHPVIIPKESHLAELLIRDAHERTLHGGPQLVLSYLIRHYWIIHARGRIRRLTHQCVTCTRFKARLLQQQMAPLPYQRVTPTRAFKYVGLDYAGPFMLRTTEGRGHKAYKGYVALFVCMASRAVHIEVVSDYTAETFLQAFRRFVSRRGLCSIVFSDNGTTFQGAGKEIQKLFREASKTSDEIAKVLASDGVEWRFIPPRTPHFGGLWEAGVKAFKHHLRRVLGDSTLTYEEFSTICAQIKACLNSRPLSPLSSDPEDLSALTPGHLLIGSALSALPEPYAPEEPIPFTRRHQMLVQMRNSFWNRWQKEVLHTLQQRPRWLKAHDEVKEGDLVIVTDDSTPPTKWPLARVISCHPGADGLVRVVTLKTATTTLKRPVVKIFRLPNNERDLFSTVQGPDDFTSGGNAVAPVDEEEEKEEKEET